MWKYNTHVGFYHTNFTVSLIKCGTFEYMMSQRPLPVAEDLPVLPNANEGPKSIPDTMPSTSSNPKASPTTSIQNIENNCVQSVGIGGLIIQSTSLTDPKTMNVVLLNI
ncbi:uncharacterized protein LOC144597950 isoform X3 [Rhinoraja longicauda]